MKKESTEKFCTLFYLHNLWCDLIFVICNYYNYIYYTLFISYINNRVHLPKRRAHILFRHLPR